MRRLIVLLAVVLPAWPASAATIYVPDDYPTIQGAINAASNGDVVTVRPGTYFENIDFMGKAVLLKSEQGPEATIIDGSQLGTVVTFRSEEDDSSILEGFAITNGSGTSWDWVYGGGILCRNESSPVIRGNIIKNNTALGGLGLGRGGGIFCTMSSPVIENNVIEGNSAFDGGGLCWERAAPVVRFNAIRANDAFYGGGICALSYCSTIDSNLVVGNVANYSGGGIRCSFSHSGTYITNNMIAYNSAASGGGGLYFDRSSATAVNNVLYGNSTEGDGGVSYGGGILVSIRSEPHLINNTIIKNSAEIGGGGICSNRESLPLVVNCILWGNDAPIAKEIWVTGYWCWVPTALSISHSAVEGGISSVGVGDQCDLYWGAGMIEDDPLFVDLDNDDWHLTYGSPCINAGLNTPPGLELLDIEGDPRIAGGRADIGADEFYFHLYHAGVVSPGSSVDFRVVGGPGMPVLLGHDLTIQDPPQSTAWGDLFLAAPPAWSSKVGTIPANGVLSVPVTLPSFWIPGEDKYFQALVGAPGGPHTTLTNLDTLQVE